MTNWSFFSLQTPVINLLIFFGLLESHRNSTVDFSFAIGYVMH